MQFKFVAFSALIQDRPLPWDTPMRDLLKAPDAGDFVWRRLHYVFELDDPRAFPHAELALTREEDAVLRRFVDQARRLADTSFLGGSDSVTIHIPDDGSAEDEVIEQDLADPDITAGYMVFLRQCYADDEEASFSKVRKILERRLYEAGETSAIDTLKRWRKAHAQLLNQTLEEHVQERMVRNGLMPGASIGLDGQPESDIVRSPASPRELLQTFWYGDHIHWGKHRDALAAIQADPFFEGMWEIEARQASTEVAHFYLGFAVLLEAALGESAR